MGIEEVWDKSIGVLPRHGNPAPEILGLRPTTAIIHGNYTIPMRKTWNSDCFFVPWTLVYECQIPHCVTRPNPGFRLRRLRIYNEACE